MCRARVVQPYRSQYHHPIRFAAGDIVTVGRRDTDWPAYAWTTTADGNAGWAPIAWLEPLDDGLSVALRDYSAQELDVDAGDELVLHYEVGGWWWAQNPEGRLGYVPATHLEPVAG